MSAARSSFGAMAEAKPAGVDPAYVQQCRMRRWQHSGIVCTDSRVGERLIEVICEVPTHGGPPDFATAPDVPAPRRPQSARQLAQACAGLP